MGYDTTLGLKQLFQIMLKRIWLIILTTIIFVLAAGIISHYFLSPAYKASTTIIIGNSPKQSEGYGYNYDDVLMYQQLAKTYQVIATSKTVAENAAKELGKAVSPEEVSSKTEITTMTDTQAMVITVTSISGDDASKTANAIAAAFIDEAMRIFPRGNVQIMDRASSPKSPVSPRPILNMVIALLLGLLLSIGIIIIRECLDSTVKNESDVNNLIGVQVVGIIPQYREK